MQLHIGRLIDHVHIVVSDLQKSRDFYREILASIGRKLTVDTPEFFGSDELFVSEANATSKVSHIHLAFQAGDRQAVQRFHAAALQAGGLDNGKPGERSYHPGYYGAFILDPDGNNIEAVYHGPAERSADSVVITAIVRGGAE